MSMSILFESGIQKTNPNNFANIVDIDAVINNLIAIYYKK